MCNVLYWALFRVQRQMKYGSCPHRLLVKQRRYFKRPQIIIICAIRINVKREVLRKYSKSSEKGKINLWKGSRNQEKLHKIDNT